MTIGSVTLNFQSNLAAVQPIAWGSDGLSMAGVPAHAEFGITEKIITLFFRNQTQTKMSELQSYLSTKQNQNVTITPNTGDDMGIGISGATAMIYLRNSFQAEPIRGSGNRWNFSCTFRYLS